MFLATIFSHPFGNEKEKEESIIEKEHSFDVPKNPIT
jgi:hypothetical protein